MTKQLNYDRLATPGASGGEPSSDDGGAKMEACVASPSRVGDQPTHVVPQSEQAVIIHKHVFLEDVGSGA